MNTTRYLLSLLYFFLSYTLSFAQQIPAFNCGFDLPRTPAQENAIQSFDTQVHQYLLSLLASNVFQKGAFAPPYVVPVVVHILHDGGAENIPDGQVFAAIEHLNEAFAAQGYFGQLGATTPTQIQFCLAKRDPDGHATTGITRTQSTLTNIEIETQDLQAKDLIRWDPLNYVNIWVVREIVSLSAGAGVSGYAYFPSVHGLPIDGIVCEAKYFGTSPAEDGLLIHEMGHYLGLYHTFEGGCPNNDCTLDGDKVCDTPPDHAIHTACPFNSCSTDVAPGSPFLVDGNDLTGDFMDYSPFSCYYLFTANQATRMQVSLELARQSLLSSKGCQIPCSQAIDAAFSAVPNPVFAGQTLVLTNNSTNASNFSWSANGVEFAQTQNTSFVFNNVGQQIIALKLANSDPNCAEEAFQYVDVLCPVQVGFLPSALEVLEDSIITLTNTSSGTGPINYEWSIDGQVVSNTTDLSFIFENSGYYTVLLRAIGPYCQQETTVLIKIANPCGILPDPVHVAYTSIRKLFQPRDMVAMPDGSLVQCGEHFQQPMVTKWDSLGNLLWNRELAINSSFSKVEPTPDGQFLLTGVDLDLFPFVSKTDGDGNLVWIKTFANNTIRAINHMDFLAVNPDGTFGLLVEDESLDSTYLVKLSADGDILWASKIPKIGMAGSLQVSSNSSGDFAFLVRDFPATPKFSVLFFGQDGSFKSNHTHSLPFSPNWVRDITLDMHEDGGYSIFYVTNNGPVIRKSLFRYQANGTLQWARRYNLLSVNQYSGCYSRKLPDEKGWLMVDSRIDANGLPLGDFLERLDSSGQVLWTRYLGDTPVNDVFVMPPVLQNGRIRSLHCDFFNQDINLLSFEDSADSVPCISLVPNEETFSLLMTSLTQSGKITDPALLSMIDLPLGFTNVTLTKTVLCTTISNCPEICDNQLDDDKDGYVDCFDMDCDCFELDTSCLTNHPDARIVLDSTQCSLDSFEVFLSLCNQGSTVLPNGMPIAFYLGDPTSTAAPLLFTSTLDYAPLEAGNCIKIQLKIPATYNTSIFALVNDDGTLPRPFNLSTNFPPTSLVECQYLNNLISFPLQNQAPTLDLGPDLYLCKSSVVELSANSGFQKFRWQDGSDAPNFTAFTAGKYWVNALDACGFQQTDTVNILLNTLATLDLPNEFILCEGASIDLTATGFLKYTWAPIDFVNCSDCATIQIEAKNSFTLQLTASVGDCFVSDSVRIQVNPIPDIQLLAVDGTCDTDASITPSVLSAGPFAFLWSNLSTDSVLNITNSGSYFVEITDQNGCHARDSAVVIDFIALEITAAISNPGCALASNAAIDLSVQKGTPPIQYLWSTNATTEDLSNLSSGTYTVLATDVNGCTTTISETLMDPPALILNLEKTDPHCPGEFGSIQLTTSGGTTGLSFLWSNAATTEDLSMIPAGTYSVTVTETMGGCTSTDAVDVLQGTSPIGIVAADSVRCFGEMSGAIQILSTSGGTPPFRYSIDNQHFITDPVFKNLSAGIYQIYILDAKDCAFSTSIEVAQPALFSVKLTGDSVLVSGAIAHLQAIVQPPGLAPSQILWTANALELVLNQLEVSTEILQNTLFELKISTYNGCEAFDSWQVMVETPYLVYAPNIIYPDNPNPSNQSFLLFAGEDVQEIESLNIFDRWGDQVFSKQHIQANDKSQGWAGDFRGNMVPPGVYVWQAKVLFKDGILKVISGDLTVYR